MLVIALVLLTSLKVEHVTLNNIRVNTKNAL